MDTLHLEFASPKALILATRDSAASFSPDDDQVWELELCDHTVHPVSLHTTYGLRAREMRLFPSFTIENKRIACLRDYVSQPAITRYLPDAFRVACSPAHGVIAQWEGYLPGQDILIGTLLITNQNQEKVYVTIELAALLAPIRKGTPCHPDKDGINQIIVGQSGTLFPVLFMTGGPSAVSSPFPTLVVPVLLEPGQSRRLTWSLVTKNSFEDSLAAARRISAVDWQSAVRQKTLEQERQTLHIRTGEPSWDAAFFLAQVQARSHFSQPSPGHPQFFLRSRLPDNTPSMGKESSSPDDLTLLELQHLFSVLGPANVNTLADILDSFLSRVAEDGLLPSRMFNAPYNNPVRECPVLARLYLALFNVDADSTRLEKAFPGLCRYFDRWFTDETGTDYNRLPIWDDLRQLQCDSGLFQFDIWEETGGGLGLKWTLSPALLAMLSSEATALSQIARILKNRSAQKKFNEVAKSLHDEILSTWDEKSGSFPYRDIQSHLKPGRELYFPGRVQPRLEINKVFFQPQRLQLHLISKDENTRVCRLRICGSDPEGNLIEETIKPHQVRWVLGRAHITTAYCYQSLESLSIEGLKPDDRFLLETADFSQPDITCLLPLWSDDVTEEQCNILISDILNPEAEGCSFGIPEAWEAEHEIPQSISIETNILWNTLIIDGLLQTGHRDIAAQLFSTLMVVIQKGFHQYAGFFPYYDMKSGQPLGTRNALSGLPPVQLFLSIAGIRIFSPLKVALWGRNPFPWPVEVHWQGLSIRREGSESHVTFPDGSLYQNITEKPLLLTMAQEEEVHHA